jgi:hypothetical protein
MQRDAMAQSQKQGPMENQEQSAEDSERDRRSASPASIPLQP